MLGPDTAWYLVLAAFLFGIGALGVLIRRNPLIVLLSLELMLNGGNLALIAVSLVRERSAPAAMATLAVNSATATGSGDVRPDPVTSP